MALKSECLCKWVPFLTPLSLTQRMMCEQKRKRSHVLSVCVILNSIFNRSVSGRIVRDGATQHLAYLLVTRLFAWLLGHLASKKKKKRLCWY
jgi:hypothetical protein